MSQPKPEPMLFSVRAFGRFCLHVWAMMLTLGVLHEFPPWFMWLAVIFVSMGLHCLWVDIDRRRALLNATEEQ